MKVLQVNVSNNGRGTPKDNQRRIDWIDQMLTASPADVCVLPGGYLSCRAPSSNLRAVWNDLDKISTIASKRHAVILGGFDCVPVPAQRVLDGGARLGTMPFLGFAVGLPTTWYGNKSLIFRQTSSTSKNFQNSLLVPDWGRWLDISAKPKRSVFMLMCGELYRDDIDHIYREKPSVIAVCGHINMSRPGQSLQRASTLTGGLAIISQHFSTVQSSLSFARQGQSGLQTPTVTIPNTINNAAPWIAGHVWIV